jgi:hypothetical protein
MRLQILQLTTVALVCAVATSAQTPTPSDVTVGTTYDITRSVELRDGPGLNHEKKINRIASKVFQRIDYFSVDSSTTVKVVAVKDDWVEIQVVEPASFATTHQGWIPISALKRGKATSKRNGYVSHTCFVYTVRDAKAKRIGYLTKGSAIHVVDDGSGWLEIPKGSLVPVMDMKTKDFLDEGEMKQAVYFETSHFTEIHPSRQ